MQVAMDFSKSQQEDMLHLRRLFYGKLGQLSRARAAIMDQLPAEAQHVTDLPSNKAIAHDLADTTDWADQLCTNGAEESRAHLFCAVALYGGVSFCFSNTCSDFALALNTLHQATTIRDKCWTPRLLHGLLTIGKVLMCISSLTCLASLLSSDNSAKP